MRKAKVITAAVAPKDGQGDSLEAKLNTWLETAGEAQILHVGYVAMNDKTVTAVVLYDDPKDEPSVYEKRGVITA